VPTVTHTDTAPQHYLLSTVRQSQAAVIDTIRTWTTITEQLTRTLRLPVPEVDVTGLVDRTFDLAERTLAAQHQLARALAGVAARQVDTAAETLDTAVTAAETASPKQDRKFDGRTYEERTVEELRERAAELEIEGRSSMSKDDLIAALRDHRRQRSAKNDAPQQERTPDRRTYEERTVEELRERAGALEIEGRSTMSKDELIAALRQHAK
jgi:Rho termination factor, N-terminal domain